MCLSVVKVNYIYVKLSFKNTIILSRYYRQFLNLVRISPCAGLIPIKQRPALISSALMYTFLVFAEC